MADRLQITPLISAETRELLRQKCQELRCSQGDLVEPALMAFLTPSEDRETLKQLAFQQEQTSKAIEEVRAMLEEIMTALTTPHETPAPKIATYDQMYGPIAAPVPPAAQELPLPPLFQQPPLPWWKRWLYREDDL